MKTQNETIKALRSMARNNNLVFKKTSETYNGAQCWAFFGNQGRTSVSQGLGAWREDLAHGNVDLT